MAFSNVKSGYKASFESKIEDKDGDLIVISKTRSNNLFSKYDAFRITYCTTRRKAHLWKSFREGKLDIFTLIYGLYLRIFGGK